MNKDYKQGSIRMHPGRRQPYTVWVGGDVLLFTGSLPKARAVMRAQIEGLWEMCKDFGKDTVALEAMVKAALDSR